MRIGFDIDGEDAFVDALGRFHAEAVAVDQHPGIAHHRDRHCRRVNLHAGKCPVPLEAAQMLDVTGEARPVLEARLAGNRRLGIGQPQAGAPHAIGRHASRGGQMLDEDVGGRHFAVAQIGKKVLGLRPQVIEIRTGGEFRAHVPPCVSLRSAIRCTKDV